MSIFRVVFDICLTLICVELDSRIHLVWFLDTVDINVLSNKIWQVVKPKPNAKENSIFLPASPQVLPLQ